jgi:hypothetical protein
MKERQIGTAMPVKATQTDSGRFDLSDLKDVEMPPAEKVSLELGSSPEDPKRHRRRTLVDDQD